MGNYEELSFTEEFKSDVQKLPKDLKLATADLKKWISSSWRTFSSSSGPQDKSEAT